MEAQLDDWKQRVRRGDDVTELMARLPEVFELLARGRPSVRETAEQLVRALVQREEGRLVVLHGAMDELFGVALDPMRTDAQARAVCADVVKIVCCATASPRAPAGGPVFRPEFLQLIVGSLKDPDVGVTAKAEACLTHILLDRGLREDAVVASTFYPAITALMKQNDEISVRVLEGVAQALAEEADKKRAKRVAALEEQHKKALQNPHNAQPQAVPAGAGAGHVEVYDNEAEIYKVLQELGVLDSIADGVMRATDDVLLLLNYLEVLESVTRSPYGVSFCATRSALGARLADLARQNLIDSVSGFSLRFISNFAQHSPENCKYALDQGWFELTKGFAGALANDVSTYRGLEGLAGIVTSPCGLDKLAAGGEFYSIFMKGALSTHTDLKEAALHSAAMILESTFNYEALATPAVFDAVFKPDAFASKQAIARVLQLRSHPVQTVRLAAIRFIAGLCRHRGALPFLTECQLTWDWLVDPDVEMDVMCKETKYGAIQHLAKFAEFIEGTRDAKEVMELRVVAKMGPYYTRRSVAAPMLDYED